MFLCEQARPAVSGCRHCLNLVQQFDLRETSGEGLMIKDTKITKDSQVLKEPSKGFCKSLGWGSAKRLAQLLSQRPGQLQKSNPLDYFNVNLTRSGSKIGASPNM